MKIIEFIYGFGKVKLVDFFKLTAISTAAMLIVGCGGVGDSSDDTSPDDFYFTAEYDVGLGEYIVSDYITVEGIDTETTISIVGGEYSIDGGEFTDEEGEINDEQIVYVRLLSSDLLSTETEATLTVGDYEDSFTVTTVDVALRARDGFKTVVFSWPAVSGAASYRLLEKKNETAEFEQKGRVFSSSAIGYTMDVAVHKQDWLGAEYKLEACTNAYCSNTDAISLYNYMRQAVGYIKASNTEASDQFGTVAISADGNTFAIGAPGEDSGSLGVNRDEGDNSKSASGAVYVYVKDDESWRLQAYIKTNFPDEGDGFGSALSLSGDGNTLAIGAPYEDSAATIINGDITDNTEQDSGAAYVFRRFGDTWFQQSYLKGSRSASGDLFGSKVELSDFGATLAVAATGSDVELNGDAGAVYVFSLSGDNWGEQSYLTAPVPATGDDFGSALSLTADGNRLVVGAKFSADETIATEDGSAVLAGKAHIFNRSGQDWNYGQTLMASNKASGQQFGASVAIAANGEVLVVGAPGESSNAFGVDGDQADTSFKDAGAAYIFNLSGQQWSQDSYLKALNSDTSDRFGSSIAINGDGSLIAVGAVGESSSATALHGNEYDNSATDAGAVYTFSNEDGWHQLSYVKAPNTDAGDKFGASLSLDSSGNALLVGAPLERSTATGLSGSQTNNNASKAGAAYLY
ncbi:FG-GAP repeat protein [Teredinibacter waterburyi]|uniref:FG-GAP repeat protein n=1 Tax=Teredinibacter waterburyi TaxID=1500538 RepID=UPI001FEB856B|nr:FG-GAP repeat protein [Teredinibacter waterburyi]